MAGTKIPPLCREERDTLCTRLLRQAEDADFLAASETFHDLLGGTLNQVVRLSEALSDDYPQASYESCSGTLIRLEHLAQGRTPRPWAMLYRAMRTYARWEDDARRLEAAYAAHAKDI
jgi:hypothetical protein